MSDFLPAKSRLRLLGMRTLACVVLFLAAWLSVPYGSGANATQTTPNQPNGETRIAVVGLDHDHVWELLKYLQAEVDAKLVAIVESRAVLVAEAKAQLRSTPKFYSSYVQMLDEIQPDAVVVTTSNDRHLEILRECAKRHIHYSVEKPMATNAADAREMEQLANQAGIKLMVNYWNAWVPPSHELFRRVRDGQLGPVEKIIVAYGHSGPREIGVSQYFADWLYDPTRNGGGAIMDFGCYGAELALWLKGRPTRVFATAKKLKVAQHNAVDDDSTIVLDYPDATVIVEASWDWPYGMDQVEVFGPKGSLLATGHKLFYRPAGANGLDGEQISPEPLPREAGNPISYFIGCIRHGKAIEDPLSPKLNVEVMEILDAAQRSVRTGQEQELH